MKRLLFTLLLTQIGLIASAQDLIVLKDATEIPSKIVNISTKSVKYLEWDNLSGPTYTLDRDDVLLVKFADGKEKLFPKAMSNARRFSTLTTIPGSFEEIPDVYIPDDPTRRTKVTFQGYLGYGLGTNAKQSLMDLDCSLGARVYDYFYAGAELGYGMYKNKKADKSTFKLYFEYGVNLRGYIPVGDNVYPFLSLIVGGVAAESSEVNSKFFCRLSAGLDWKSLSAGAGWNRVCDSDYFFVQIAWRFGK